MNAFDLIIVGGGPAGLSVACGTSRAGQRVLVLEQFGFFNHQGSSAGTTRQFHLQHPEHALAELAKASLPHWRALQSYSVKTLLRRDGCLWLGEPDQATLSAALANMHALGIHHNQMTADEVQAQFAFRNLPESFCGLLQEDGGTIHLKATEETLYNLAEESGAALHEHENVTGIDSQLNGEIVVHTANADYACEKLVICAGPYTNQLLSLLNARLDISLWQMASAYYKKLVADVPLPCWTLFPKPASKALYFGFPDVDWCHKGYVRVATDLPDRILESPADRSFKPTEKGLSLGADWVARHLRGVQPHPRFANTCIITLTQDLTREVLLDYAPGWLPNHHNIVVFAGGWAAKYIPIAGLLINQMLANPIQSFQIDNQTLDREPFLIDWQLQPRDEPGRPICG